MKKRPDRRTGKTPEESPTARAKKRLLLALLDIPSTALAAVSRLEISGNREAIVEGCQGVLEYGDTIIRLSTGRMVLRFEGRGLQISVLTHQTAVITGFITNIAFS